MFLNISNHPLEKWSPEQLMAARSLGHGVIASQKFPNVPPSYTMEEVAAMAKGLVADVEKDYPQTGEFLTPPRIAMIQGEFSLTWELTRRLHALGWRVVVACSERNVIDNPDGTKTVRFQFVQFREVRK